MDITEDKNYTSDKMELIVDSVSSVFSRSPNRTRVCIYHFVQIRISVCCIAAENVLNGKKQTNPKVQFTLCWLGISENVNFYFWLQKGLIMRAFVTKFSGLLFEREMWLEKIKDGRRLVMKEQTIV